MRGSEGEEELGQNRVSRRGEGRLLLEIERLPRTPRGCPGRVVYPALGYVVGRAFVSL
jgi:hypothetical protein